MKQLATRGMTIADKKSELAELGLRFHGGLILRAASTK